MRIPYWLLRLLPMWEYICPKCKKEVKKNSHECPHCGEKYPLPLKASPSFLKDPKKLEAYVHQHVFPRISEFERNYLTKYFTEIFNNGFEEGNFSAWTNTVGTPTIVTSPVHHGTYAASFNAVSEYAEKNFNAQTTVYIRLYVQVDTLPPSNGNACVFMAFGGTDTVGKIAIAKDSNLIRLQVRYYYPNENNYVTYSFAINTWYCVELKFVKATSGAYQVWIDGSSVFSVTKNTSSAPNITWIIVGQYDSGYTSTDVIDCVVVADTYIGPEGEAVLKTVTDSLSLSDSVFRNKPSLTITDSLAAADAIKRDKTFAVTDTIGASDTALRNKPSLTIMDSVGLADALKRDKAFTIADVLGLADVILLNKTLAISDNVGASDVALGNKAPLIVADSISLADLVNVITGAIIKTVLDSIGLADVVYTPSRVLQTLDSMGLADNIIVNKVLQITETINLVEIIQVGVGGVKKTKLFLILGDLAVQLTGN